MFYSDLQEIVQPHIVSAETAKDLTGEVST